MKPVYGMHRGLVLLPVRLPTESGLTDGAGEPLLPRVGHQVLLEATGTSKKTICITGGGETSYFDRHCLGGH